MKETKNLKLLNVYYLVDKNSGKVTFGPLATRSDAREMKNSEERIVQAQPVFNKFVR